MKILVTGGAGFIGSTLADALIADNHQVEIIDNLFTGRKENLPADAVFHEIGIEDDECAGVFEKGQFDVVYHLAAQMDVRKSVADPAFDARSNILGGINILQNCRKYGVKKLIFASTGGAIYSEEEPYPAAEDHNRQPLSPYGISKLAFEKYLYFYRNEFGLEYVSLRYANVYGPRQRSDGEAGVVAIFCSRMLSGEQAYIFGDGKQTRDFTFVGDVVKANLLALDYNKSGIFNVGTGVETDINTLFDTLVAVTGSDQKQEHKPGLPGEVRRSVLDNSHIKKTLGWQPEYNLESGLKLTVDHFKRKIADG